MLLAAVPDPIRRELISSRKLQSVEILYALLCRFQPGGVHEKTSLLKDLTENRLGANANIHELLQTLRVWRRNLGRSAELGIQLPDPLILVGVLGRWSDHLDALEDPKRFTECRRFDKTCSWTSSQRMSRLLTLRRRCRPKLSSCH